ncbi:PDR/VanB family oxidoreductase [Pseudarthrobacter sp. SSS035]|uniref:PDR/VanB family oxidoreductase n=1 Tax=Pseudarthrobacter sp. SSS035 TaxID=2931399 RepID=UPI002112B7D4|nr:PDR/VanB family oxidoreductase [Pseudarthrobacter sp. SSS035]
MREQTLPAPRHLLQDFFSVQVREVQREADGVVSVLLGPLDSATLPRWSPGAHIDVLLPNDMLRQYSLISDPDDQDAWRIAVLLDSEGRGGSKYIHTALKVGDSLEARGPRNHFLRGSSEGPTQFIAGGIGITPLLSMVREAAQNGADWNLLYLGSDRNSMPFLSELLKYGDRVRVHSKSEHGAMNLTAFIQDPGPPSVASTYACGPHRMLTELGNLFRNDAHGEYYRELFDAAGSPVAGVEDSLPFVVETSDGSEVEVAADETIIDALDRVGIRTLSSCRKGTCGTCETEIIDGLADHRDAVLSDEERAAGETMMICVSRCVGDRLVLDL